ncbi:hypothetical protein IWX63_000177 [Arthrobacter sp. CAN_A2]
MIDIRRLARDHGVDIGGIAISPGEKASRLPLAMASMRRSCP